jgi:hypothetical protein
MEAIRSICAATTLEHDAEKWEPVFGKDDAAQKALLATARVARCRISG